MTATLGRETVQNIVRGIKDGQIFSVTFVKKDKTLRRMVCRLGVKKDIKGTGNSYNPAERNNLIVFDMQKKAYRTINLDTITEVRLKGDDIKVAEAHSNEEAAA